MALIRVTNVQVYKPQTRTILQSFDGRIREKQKNTQVLEMSFKTSDLMEKAQIESYRKKYKTLPELKVQLTYEEI